MAFMCTVLILRGFHEDFPVLVAANRDEDRSRKFSPPGLTIGERRRMLSPKDRRAGGTWLGVNDRGVVAALTNVVGEGPIAGPNAHDVDRAAVPPSRGLLPHIALDADAAEAGVDAVEQFVSRGVFAGFRMAIVDSENAWICRWAGGVFERVEVQERMLLFSNEHDLGAMNLPGLERATGPLSSADHRLDLLRPLLLADGEGGGPAPLKRGDAYGTVSSSLLAVPARDPAALIWRFAAGSPDQVPYRNYGNLGRRLVPEA